MNARTGVIDALPAIDMDSSAVIRVQAGTLESYRGTQAGDARSLFPQDLGAGHPKLNQHWSPLGVSLGGSFFVPPLQVGIADM